MVLGAISLTSLGGGAGHIFALGARKLYGLFLLLFAARFVLSALEAFHRSYYFRGLATVLRESGSDAALATTWEVATIVSDTDPADVTAGFMLSKYGEEVLYRAGVAPEPYEKFFHTRAPTLTAGAFYLERDRGVTLPTYTKSLVKQDAAFASFLASQNITADDVTAAAGWVERMLRAERYRKRWWSRDNLGRIPGLGKGLSYGESYLIEKYGYEMNQDPSWLDAVDRAKSEDDEVEALEAVLARARQANVLLVGDDESGKHERIAQLYRKILEGHALPPIESCRVFRFDIEAVIAAMRDKVHFEAELRRVLNGAIHAGDLILYIDDLTAACSSANVLGTDLVDLLVPYLQARDLHIVAGARSEGYHKTLSRDSRVMQYFELVQMHDIDESGLLTVLEQRAIRLEHGSRIAFSYPALRAVARLANRYFPDGVMPDKALDLMEELVPHALSAGHDVVYAADVEGLVAQKTGVPLGTPTDEERDKLLRLEAVLHERVVGQNEAVEAVARALRRARAGVGSAEKPMGSFLFLGPTGVGKTETAKALAFALFKDEDAMIRFDMSEYQGVEALRTLLGSADTGSPGRLPVAVKERPYGVLLLDEFEKSDRTVHDIFLQILDEGECTDAFGKEVNVRNHIIIATTNAAADLVWKWEREPIPEGEKKDALIDVLVSRGLFRPEFLNRFDDLILFHTLSEEHIRTIARIQLELLAKRLADRNIKLVIDDALVRAVAKAGYDPRFGGRPMRRIIKDKVEQAVADRLLAGTLKPGDHVTLTAADIA